MAVLRNAPPPMLARGLPAQPSEQQVKQVIDAYKGAPITLSSVLQLAPGMTTPLNDEAMTNPTTFVMEVHEVRWAIYNTISLTPGV